MALFTISESVYSKKTNSSWLILSPEKDSYLELDDVASFIWDKLQKPISPEQIAKKITTTYNVDYETALKDTVDFIQLYLKKKLLQEIK